MRPLEGSIINEPSALKLPLIRMADARTGADLGEIEYSGGTCRASTAGPRLRRCPPTPAHR